jgi:hypothetical protein
MRPEATCRVCAQGGAGGAASIFVLLYQFSICQYKYFLEYVLKLKQLASRAEEVDARCYILAASMFVLLYQYSIC